MHNLSFKTKNFDEMNDLLIGLSQCDYIGQDLIDMYLDNWNYTQMDLEDYLSNDAMWNDLRLKLSSKVCSGVQQDAEIGIIIQAIEIAKKVLIPSILKVLKDKQLTRYLGYVHNSRLVIYTFD